MARYLAPRGLDRQQPRHRDFDPAAEGAQYGLPAAALWLLWEQAQREAVEGHRNDEWARQRFHDLARRAAARRSGRAATPGKHTLQTFDSRVPDPLRIPEPPGKRTQVERNAPTEDIGDINAVQRKTVAALRPAQALQIAASGIAHAGGALPHGSLIQRAFGRHRLDGVRVQIGGAASTAGRALGATAYAAGDRIAFAAAPDLHTAAHEAAHVIQQRAGIVPAGLGAAGDEHEHAADRIADAVVAGRSAEPLLDRYLQLFPGRAAASAVQRKSDDAAPAGKLDVAWAYLRAHSAEFVSAIRHRLTLLAPPVISRIVWRHGGLGAMFGDALEAAIRPDPLFARLPDLMSPIDPWRIIDTHRALTAGTPGVIVDGQEPLGPLAWNPLVGEALALEIAPCIHDSLVRMAPRYLARLDARPGRGATADALVTSHPMDRVTAHLLCDPRVVTPTAGATAQGGRPPRRLERWRWLDDPALWNWIEVREVGATVEDVAATLARDSSTVRANEIVASPPYFRIDPAWARTLPGVHKPDSVDRPHDHDALALAGSELATGAAIAQTRGIAARGKPTPPKLEQLRSLLEQSARQLARVAEALQRWRLRDRVLPALRWVAKLRDELMSTPTLRLTALAPVIQGQQALLFEAVGETMQLAAAPFTSVDGETGLMTAVLRHYATAIGESHLVDTARLELAAARRARAGMVFDALGQSLASSRAAVGALAASETRGPLGAAEHGATITQQQRQVLDHHARAQAGEQLDGDDVELLAAGIREVGIDARAKALYLQLYNLSQDTRDAADGGAFASYASALSCDFRGLYERLIAKAHEIDETVIKARPALKLQLMREQGGGQTKRIQAYAANQAADRVEARYAALLHDPELIALKNIAPDLIHDQQRRTRVLETITQIGVLIGVSLAGGMIGNLVAGAVRGALITDAAIGVTTGARVAGAAAGMATDAAINAVGQKLIVGGSASSSFVDNLIASAAVRAALAPLHRAVHAWQAEERAFEAATGAARTGKLAATAIHGVAMTGEMLTGAAVNHIIQQARHAGQVDAQTAASWAEEGASMVIGALIGRRLQRFEASLVGLAEHGGAALAARARQLRARAQQLELTGASDGRVLDLLAEQNTLRLERDRVLHALTDAPGVDPHALQRAQSASAADQTAARGPHFTEAVLDLAGLRPDDASGTTYAGPAVPHALDRARAAGLDIKLLSHDGPRYRVRIGDREVTIVDTEPPAEHTHDTAQHALIRDVLGASVGPTAIRELAKIDGLSRPLLEQLAGRGFAVAEQLGHALANHSSWPDNARLGLCKLAANDTADAIRLFGKVVSNIDIEGMNAWALLASRQLNSQSKLLDLEQSLNKAIEIKGFDPDVAVEVDYYQGKRVNRQERDAARARPDFDRKQHVNFDVESTTERWEMKRVDPILTQEHQLLDQVKEGVKKYAVSKLPNRKSGGPKSNIVDVEFGDRARIPDLDEAHVRSRIEQYIKKNTDTQKYIDAIIIHIDLDGTTRHIHIET